MRQRQHLLQFDITSTDGGEQILKARKVRCFGQLAEIHRLQALAFQSLFKLSLTFDDIAIAILAFKPTGDFGSGPTGGHITEFRIEPVPARSSIGCGQDFHLIAGLKLVI